MKKEEGFKRMQIESYHKLAGNFDKSQKRENRNHINKIKAISNFLDIKEGNNVLEIGVGTGIHAKYLQAHNKIKFNFIGVDISKDMLIEAKKRLKGYENISLQEMDGENLKFKDGYFDKVYISGSLHHYENPKKGIDEILRVLKKKGKFCIMEPNYFFPTNFYAANFMKEEINMKLMRKKNFIKWIDKTKADYKIKNFAYTPPFPKSFIPVYNIIDKIISKIPLLRNVSIMLFIKGVKK